MMIHMLRMKEIPMNSLLDKLCSATDKEHALFLIWHNNKQEDKKFKDLELPLSKDIYEEWLTSSEGIDCQMIFDKHMKNYQLSLLYNSMLDKALKGDVNAARWVESFAKSDYFKESEDEIDAFLSGVSIPGLE